MITLASHAFTPSDLQTFADWSGDANPIHVDPVAARRLLGGTQVSHGILVLLWALECHFASSPQAAVPLRIRVSFLKPVLVGQVVTLLRQPGPAGSDAVRLEVRGKEPLAVILLEGVGVPTPLDVLPDASMQPARSASQQPALHSFADLKALSGEWPLALPPAQVEVVRHLYPTACSRVGMRLVLAMGLLSRIVGMACPGLHSLFAGLDVSLSDKKDNDDRLAWRVIRHTVAQAPIRMHVQGGGLAGSIDAFVRPEPASQPGMAEVMRRVERGGCERHVALVIGGSRGLGELTAKIVAAGGGMPIISYQHGREDAERVAGEIIEAGGHCHVLQIDVQDPSQALDMLRSGPLPTHVYFFASGRIEPQTRCTFDADVYEALSRVHVEAFGRTVDAIAALLPAGWRMFYPSTVFIDESPKAFKEYVVAKTAGEALCAQLDRHHAGGRIISRRLPRMLTDQTAGVARQGMADALSVMLEVVREVHQPETLRKEAGQ